MTRNFCFTLNNYADAHLDMIAALFPDKVSFIMYGREVGELGTPHLQGFLVTQKAARLKAVVKLLPGAHVTQCTGSAESNVTYCSKSGDTTSYGVAPISKAASGAHEKERWDIARLAAQEGRFADVPSDIYMRLHSNCHKIYAESQPALVDLPELKNEWLWGASGVGKSKRAREENPGAYPKNKTKWWDHYARQPTVIIDDISPFTVCLTDSLKEWGDHYPFPAELKGNTQLIRPQKIVITSQYPINLVFKDEETREAIHRRYQEIYMPSDKATTDNNLVL